MEFKDNLDCTTLLLGMPIKVYFEDKVISLNPIPISKLLEKNFSFFLSLIREKDDVNSFNFLTAIFSTAGRDRPNSAKNEIKKCLEFVFEDFEITKDSFKIQNISITQEIWQYLVMIILKSNGEEKIMKKTTFNSEAEREKYELEQRAAERIRKVKEKSKQKSGDVDGFAKMLLVINYALNIPFEWQKNQCLMLLLWLYRMGGKICSYDVEKIAYATGNMGKNKLKFFLEK